MDDSVPPQPVRLEATSDEGVREQSQALRNARLTRNWATMSLLCAVCVLEIETICRVPFLNGHRYHCFAALIIMALVIWGVPRPKLQQQMGVDRILSFYRDSRYWMVLLLIAAVITQAVLPFRSPLSKPMIVRAAAPPPPPAPAPPPPPPAPVEVTPEFPELKVTGFVLNGARSTAVINGRTVMVGEEVAGVKIVRIEETRILAELEEHTKEYPIGEEEGG